MIESKLFQMMHTDRIPRKAIHRFFFTPMLDCRLHDVILSAGVVKGVFVNHHTKRGLLSYTAEHGTKLGPGLELEVMVYNDSKRRIVTYVTVRVEVDKRLLHKPDGSKGRDGERSTRPARPKRDVR